MATVNFLLGLCGSGKTWLADRIAAGKRFDEGFLNDNDQHQDLIAALGAGLDCVVVEIHYCIQDHRQQIVAEIMAAVANARINWLCIENDLFRANKNCQERTNKADPAAHIAINQNLSPQYTYPDGATIFRMWTKGG